MPNFNTHWLAAIRCIESSDKLPEGIKNGYEKYCTLTGVYKKRLTSAINAVVNPETHKEFTSSEEDLGLNLLLNNYNIDLNKPENRDPITLFSAYMLGACGPDFWTLPSSKRERRKLEPDVASFHFDLGHYNRTHQQFIVAIKHWRKKDKNSFQVKVEQAYFYGMATHIATDCVVHQLVNVYAGAYHLLVKSNWKNEHDTLSRLYHPWNTHNKVEHFWDSYIRYRYLGDISRVFDDASLENDPMTPLGFPTVEELIDRYEGDISRVFDDAVLEIDPMMTPLGFPTVEKFIDNLMKERTQLIKNTDVTRFSEEEKKKHYKKIEMKEHLADKTLRKDKVKFKIEQAFNFPRIFCDRVIQGQIKPFLYDIIVENTGAYEPHNLFPAAIAEKKSFQMEGPLVKGKQTHNENKKLAYFSSGRNTDASVRGTSFNFLNYYVCPNLERVRKFGGNVFYHTQALKHFIDSAVTVGNAFISDLAGGINSTTRDISIVNLGKFWNLDTGLGVEVKNLPSDTRYEVITELNFIHVTEAVRRSKITYVKEKDPGYLNGKTVITKIRSQEDVRAFKTYKGGPFKSPKAIFEGSACLSAHRYLDRINLYPKEGHIPLSDCTIENFFSIPKETKNNPQPVPTEKNKKNGNVLQAQDIKHRLTLNMRVPIAEVADHEKLGFYVHNDSSRSAEKQRTPDEWMKSATVIDYTKTEDKNHTQGRFLRNDGLCVFNTRFLMNLDRKRALKRLIEKGKWNNAIKMDPGKPSYGINFSVSTGRENVLHPKSGGQFNARADFGIYNDVSPTDQTFFTLYRLVQTKDGCFDMVSRKSVGKTDLQDIKRIDALGFVKIVLFYQLTNKGALQATECLIDGLPVKVEYVNNKR